MKIALIGYGRMGREIERLALAAGDEVVLKITVDNLQDLTQENLRKADVAIEFSQPAAAVDNIRLAVQAGVPIVVGTTGWLAQLPEVEALVAERGGAVLHASNFSLGVNVFFAAARQLGNLLGQHGDYEAGVEEIHHTGKLDAPSGTAITLAERFADGHPNYASWELTKVTSPVEHQAIAPPELGHVVWGGGPKRKSGAEASGKSSEKSTPVPIESVREEGVPGTHVLRVGNHIDTIELKHTAHSREGFAQGALAAARWLPGKTGVFTMADVLGI